LPGNRVIGFSQFTAASDLGRVEYTYFLALLGEAVGFSFS
jgi:hypothetical protein